jgi:hypothetical protein
MAALPNFVLLPWTLTNREITEIRKETVMGLRDTAKKGPCVRGRSLSIAGPQATLQTQLIIVRITGHRGASIAGGPAPRICSLSFAISES